MTRQQKALAKLAAKPPPTNVRWAELRAVLEYLGYTLLTGSGSRRKFYNKDLDDLIICHEPHPSPEVDKGCIRDVVEHLRLNGLIPE